MSRLLTYVLAYRPDEFGLVPAADGSVTFKELLQALHEEPGWGYVRRSHIQEVLLGEARGLFHAEGKRIRAEERHWELDLERPCPAVPSLLFTAVRTRAHAVVMTQGLRVPEGRLVVLSPDPEAARRIGKRRHPRPVVLEITGRRALESGHPFFDFGELFVTFHVPARFISGPPVTESEPEPRKAERPGRAPAGIGPPDPGAGSFPLDITRDPDLQRRLKHRKPRGWKEAARKSRRKKHS